MTQTIDLGKVAITPGGVWDKTKSYEALTEVVNEADGCGYIALRDNVNVKPGTDDRIWMLAVQAGKSIYQLAVLRGYTGTEDQFVAEYNAAVAAANTAATEANAKMAQFTELERLRAEAELARKAAEEARIEAEKARALAEASRAAAEALRAQAEAARKEAEIQRTRESSAAVQAANTAAALAGRNASEANAAAALANEKAATADKAAKDAEEAIAKFEAPKDGQIYGRKNGTWVPAADENLAKDVARVKKTTGPYTDRPDIVLTALENNVAINKAGVKVAKPGWAIAEFEAVKGNEYLFKPGAMDGDVCIFAEKITKEEIRNIDYTYTYDEAGRIATARATYSGQQHSYTYAYEFGEEGTVISETITDDQTGAIIPALPYQYKTTVGSYQPMTVLNAAAELPADAFCRLVSHFQNDTNLRVVVSYNMASADLRMGVIRDGFTASICTQLSNLAKRIANTTEYVYLVETTVDTMRTDVDGLLHDVQTRPDFYELPLLAGQPMKLFGAGTPQEAVVPVNWIGLDKGGYAWNGQPSALGQEYINTSVNTGGHYTAVKDGEYNLKWINC